MIAQLTGRIESRDEASCVIDVGGVGYLVQASTRTIAALPSPPALARVFVETHVREDAILLYGFADQAERAWFKLLTGVQGVGPKLALSVLSALGPSELAAAIATGDKASLIRAEGVGARLATRLLAELRERAGGLPSPPGAVAIPALAQPAGLEADALSALVNLGYRRAEAQPALARALARLGAGAALDALIREGLKELAQRGPA
jgi:Holliday junction DNA helicase RuvA